VNAPAESLDAQLDPVARRAVELTYEAVPAYAAQLDARGRRHCEDDARFHVRALIASLAVDEVSIFVDYARWCEELLRGYGIDAQNLVAMFRATATAVHELAPPAGERAEIHLRAAEDALARP
jgi:MerR family transcriptional regulator, light-induced transcriptional regulator